MDLPLLLDRFICQAADELDKPVPDIPKSLIETMETYPFKGNIRELKSMVYDAMSRYQGGAISSDLFKAFTHADTWDPAAYVLKFGAADVEAGRQ